MNRPVYRWYVCFPALKRECWVDAVDEAEAGLNACRKLGLSYKEHASDARIYRVGKAASK